MNSFRTRLTLIMITMIACSVVAAGIFMGKTFRDNHIDALEDNMVRELQIISAKMEWKTGELSSLYDYYSNEAKTLKQYTGARVSFIRSDGYVLGDSDWDPQKMDNHLDRTEVADAKAHGVGRALRVSDTVNQNMMYVAITTDVVPNEDPYIIRLALSLGEIEASLKQLTQMLAIGLLVLFIIAGAISYRIASNMTKPLVQIASVAKRIKNREYNARVSLTKQDEIGELGKAINAMADSLQIQMEHIQQNENQLESVLDNMINGIVMINRDGKIVLMNRRAEEVLGFSASDLVDRHFSELKQQYELTQMIQEALLNKHHMREETPFYFPEERLVELNLVPIQPDGSHFDGVLLVMQDVSAIRRLERMRSEFVANVSHELKTPVTAVKGFAETLLSGAVRDEETTRSFLQIIYDESDRLNRLIGDILELSKIESKRSPLNLSPVEVDSFIMKSVKLVESEATRKNIELDVNVEKGLYVEADEDRLRQIIVNILSNGVNYSSAGGKVSLHVESLNDDFIRIQISDTGMGIPKKDLPRIFERFYRVDKARSRSSGGTGLGLSIVKHLVELHKGTITVTSNVGIGSTFTIELPVIQ